MPGPSQDIKVTVDVVALADRDGELHVLLVRRGADPFKGRWALPGGFIEKDEAPEQAARRELKEETGARATGLEEIGAFGEPGRDPRGRVISIAYRAWLPAAGGEPAAGSDAAEAAWWPVSAAPELAFDHARILGRALELPAPVPHARAQEAPVRLILASRSPRRAELLRRLGLAFEVRPADLPEDLSEFDSPEAASEELARRKAAAAAEEGALSIGSDTLVVEGGEILVKPTTREEALAMIERLAGVDHHVHTGIALAAPGRVESAVETTRVWFRSLDPSECAEYVATGESMDKAGAYGIQSYGAALVERIEGDYFNVMGLPIQRLLELFRRFGYRYAFGKKLIELA